jgi:nicotinamide-nucleotide amidase
VGDEQRGIEEAIRESARRCDYLVVSGGLGPTADDLTRQAVAAVLDQPLELNEWWLVRLEAFFKERKRRMPDCNRIQAMVPRGSGMIDNATGTAAGLDCVVGSGGCRVFVLPGVPKEMKEMFRSYVLPVIAKSSGGVVILSRSLHTFGLGESAIAELLGALMDRARNPSVGTTVSQGIVSVRINSRFGSRVEAQRQLVATEQECRSVLGELVFGVDDQTLPQAVAELLGAGMSVTTAESCTAGLLAKMLTEVAGSSKYFKQGWITYCNEAKAEMLGVGESLLEQHGAVSEAVVGAMARGALERAGASYGLAISGIAGPEGGTAQNPVGTVCIGVASAGPTAEAVGLAVRRFCFPGDREMIRDRSAKMALTMLRFELLGKRMPF